jgi:hypothetical protein
MEENKTQPEMSIQPEAVVEPPPVQQPVQEKTLYSWQAPSRLFKRRSREFYSTVGALVFLLSLILFFAKEILLIGVILAIGFVSYVLASVAPDEITHTLTNKGIRTGEKLFLWPSLGRYWWTDKWKQAYVAIEAPGRIPSMVILLVGKGQKQEIDDILKTYLINQKPDPTWFDNAAKWLQEKVPLESE